MKTVQKNAAGAARIVVEACVEIKEAGRTASQAEMAFLLE